MDPIELVHALRTAPERNSVVRAPGAHGALRLNVDSLAPWTLSEP